MADTIIKATRDDDFYVVYSSFWDAPFMYGTRAEIEAEYEDSDPDRFARADATGTSARFPDYQWDSNEIMIREGFDPTTRPAGALCAYVRRAALRSWCESVGEFGTWDGTSALVSWHYDTEKEQGR